MERHKFSKKIFLTVIEFSIVKSPKKQLKGSYYEPFKIKILKGSYYDPSARIGLRKFLNSLFPITILRIFMGEEDSLPGVL